MALVAYGVGLVVIWVLAWGSPSPANILSGIAVAAGLLALAPESWPGLTRPRFRPVAIGRFVLHVMMKVLESNVVITREVLARRSRIRTGVVAVPLPECSDGLLTLITNAMALTPGTMPLEVTRDPTVLYVHVLQLRDLDDARHQIQHLAALAFRAFGSDDAVAELDRDPSTPGGTTVTRSGDDGMTGETGG
ncbi:Na+/H+ antiporter subunit E [Iamia sp.]|uniref:Na+/H+ antiporter subunit E n=1 Tax=Iamia sp. TaxID=2722710 RepID=UPI002C88292B|nr:Na+/H+ antiporter subunit E [Iamia sp.]HXH57714.1 Na+/H+ antiporter subunit E [Iamia sp.]